MKKDKHIVILNEEINRNKFISPRGNRGNNMPEVGGFWTNKMNENGHSPLLEDMKNSTILLRDRIMRDTLLRQKVLRKFTIEISDNTRILTIDSQEDYSNALKKYGMPFDHKKHPFSDLITVHEVLNFEELMKDYDCIYLTTMGKYKNYDTFYTWHCESTLWLHLDCFVKIEESDSWES